MLTFGELFAGIAGFGLGLERAGMKCLWQVERDPDCNRVLEARYPSVKRVKDVREAGKHNLESVDVIAFGWPCQDLSVAGLRAGISGERSGLFHEAARVIQELRPKWIVAENVPGLYSSYTPVNAPPNDVAVGTEWEVEEDSDFESVLAALTELGYCISWRVCDAQFWGVAQRRERVFIVGSFGSLSSLEIFPLAESLPGDFETRGEAGAGAASAVTTGTGKSSGPRNGNGDPINLLVGAGGEQSAHAGTGTGSSGHQGNEGRGRGCVDIAATLKQRGRGACDEVMDNLQVSMPLKAKANSSHDESHETYVTHALSSEGADASEDGTGRGTPLVATLYHENIDGKVYESLECPALRNFQKDAPMIAFSSKDHGADAGEISPTLRAQNFKDSHINGGGQVAIAFGWNKSDSQTMRVDDQTTDALQCSPQSNPAIAFTERTRSEGRNLEAQEELAYAVTNPGSGGRTHSRQIAGGFGVRRLTPTECMRLQGFPDWWFDDEDGKKILSDSAMYRCLGNAVAVPVALWIGRRIYNAQAADQNESDPSQRERTQAIPESDEPVRAQSES